MSSSLAGRAGAAQRVAGLARVRGEREQQVLGRDVLVAELAHLALGGVQDWASSLEPPAGSAAAPPLSFGSASSAGAERLADGGRVDAELAQHGRDDAAVLLEQHREQVLGRDLRVAALVGEPLGGLERLLGLDRESVLLHLASGSSEVDKSKSVGLRL